MYRGDGLRIDAEFDRCIGYCTIDLTDTLNLRRCICKEVAKQRLHECIETPTCRMLKFRCLKHSGAFRVHISSEFTQALEPCVMLNLSEVPCRPTVVEQIDCRIATFLLKLLSHSNIIKSWRGGYRKRLLKIIDLRRLSDDNMLQKLQQCRANPGITLTRKNRRRRKHICTFWKA